MRRAKWLAAGALAALACGGGTVATVTDASLDQTLPPQEAGQDASDDGDDAPTDSPDGMVDARCDGAGWFDQFPEAGAFEGEAPPGLGEFPPPFGGDCTNGGGCGQTGGCDYGTGWCCSGKYKTCGCMCGESWGCVPPQECCFYPDANFPTCAPNADACPLQAW